MRETWIPERALLELKEEYQLEYQVHDRRYGYNVFPT